MNFAVQPLRHDQPLQIGDVRIPFDPKLERGIGILLRDVSNHVLVGPALQRMGLSDHKDELLQQLLCFPRTLTDTSFQSVRFARTRTDLGRVVTDALGKETFSPSDVTKHAAAWMELYLRTVCEGHLGEAVDAPRFHFLREAFGALPKIDGKIHQFVLASVFGNEIVLPKRVRTIIGDGERHETPAVQALEVTASAAVPVAAAPEPKAESKIESRATPQPLDLDRRNAFISEIHFAARREYLVPEASTYKTSCFLPEVLLSEALAEHARIISASDSFFLKNYSRVMVERNGGSVEVKENSMSPVAKYDFHVDVPVRLAFNSPKFGQFSVTSMISQNIFLIEGKYEGRDFKVFDTAIPAGWQRSLEKLEL